MRIPTTKKSNNDDDSNDSNNNYDSDDNNNSNIYNDDEIRNGCFTGNDGSNERFAIPPPFHHPSTFSLSRHLFTWIRPPWNDIGFLSPRNAQHGIAFDVASQFSHRAGVQASICHWISGLGLHKEGLFAYDDTPTLWKSLGPFYFVCLMISVLLVLWLCFFNSFPFF